MDAAVRVEDVDLDSTELLERVARGCAVAWRTLIDQHETSVRRSIWSFRFDAATTDDVLQSVWLKLYEHAGTINDPERVGAWLRTTARRTAIAVTRQRARAVPVGEVHGDALVQWEEPDLTLPAERTAVQRAFRKLSPKAQQLLALLFGDKEMSYREVAEIIDRPCGSVGPSRGRALDQLRSQYEVELSRIALTRQIR